MVGKPVVKGTRIPVELVLAKLAQNPSLDELFTDYPRLTLEDVKACLDYASALVERHPRATADTVEGNTASHRMKFLLDESAELRISLFLQQEGHDVKAVARDYPHGLPDDDVLALCTRRTAHPDHQRPRLLAS